MKNKFSITKAIKYMVIGGVIGVVAMYILTTVGQGPFWYALTTSKEELIQTYTEIPKATDMTQEESENFKFYQEKYDEIKQMVADKGFTENTDGIAYQSIVSLNTLMQILMVYHIFDAMFIGAISGIIFGIIIYLLTNLKIKYNALKIIIGYIGTVVISSLMVGTFTVIMDSGSRSNWLHESKVIVTYHPVEFFATTVAIYVAMITTNLVVQKIKANKFNKELSK